MAVKQVNGVDSNNTYISADGVYVSYNNEANDHNSNYIIISSNGITLATSEGVPSNTVFMADGTTALLTAISTEELNKIFV